MEEDHIISSPHKQQNEESQKTGDGVSRRRFMELMPMAGLAAMGTDGIDRGNGPKVRPVDTMAALLEATTSQPIWVRAFYADTQGGGGLFWWDPNEGKANHNGGTIIDPDHTATAEDADWHFAENTGIDCWKCRLFNYAFAVIFLLLGCLFSVYEASAQDTPVEKPNVILIMADDLGAEALGSYGSSSYETPHLDKLASTGIRFVNAYTTPLCTPTRVQIMTGQYPFRNGWTEGIWTKPRNEQYFDPDTYNFGQMMRAAGYATATAGKWQLARFGDRPYHPQNIGFDESALWTWLYTGNIPDEIRTKRENLPSRFWDAGIWKNGELLQNTGGKFGPDIYTDFLVNFMHRHQKKPFFVYYPMALTHNPFVPVPGMSSDRDGVQRGPVAQENFAMMVEYMDQLVGRIIEALDEMGERKNTLILFTTDNGTNKEIRSQLGDKIIRGGKGKLTESGTRVPLIVNWQGITPQGQVSNDLIDSSDILPTLADLIGVQIPDSITIDGRSFLPQLKGKGSNPRKWVFVQNGDDWFIRSKRWRLRKNGELAEMTNRYAPRVVKEDPSPQAKTARKNLQRIRHDLLREIIPSNEDNTN